MKQPYFHDYSRTTLNNLRPSISRVRQGWEIDKYTIDTSILNPKAVKMDELKKQYGETLVMVGFKANYERGIAFLSSFNDRKPKVVELNMRELMDSATRKSPEYKQALELIYAKLYTLSSDAIYPLIDGSSSYSEEEWIVYYLSDTNSFYIVDYAPIRRHKQELTEQARQIYFELNPTKREVARIPVLMTTYVSSIKMQARNVKINSSAEIIRYDHETWLRDIKRDIGRTAGSTIGGILRRIRTGSLKPVDGMLYVIKDNDSEQAIMSIKLSKGGHTFFVPNQSIAMYVDLIKEKFGEDNIVHLSN